MHQLGRAPCHDADVFRLVAPPLFSGPGGPGPPTGATTSTDAGTTDDVIDAEFETKE